MNQACLSQNYNESPFHDVGKPSLLSLPTIIYYLLQSKVYLFSVCEIFLKLAVVLINADENMRGNPTIKSLEVKHSNFMIKGTVSVISNPIRQRFIGRRYSYYYSFF